MILNCLNNSLIHGKAIIAGPCALESRDQLKIVVKHLISRKIRIIRASLWKPRTLPDWDGLGILGLNTLLEETIPHGVIPATEVMNLEQTKVIVNTTQKFFEDSPILLWIGSRNQNHFEIKEMASYLADHSSNISLMVKNQMWEEKKHWSGLYNHVTSARLPKTRLAGCHRGFAPGRIENPLNLRNLPNYSMAIEVKKEHEIDMLLDPSHIAGSRSKVFDIVKEAQNYPFDGYFIEVHENVADAKTDKSQQLTFDEFDALLEILQKDYEEKLKQVEA